MSASSLLRRFAIVLAALAVFAHAREASAQVLYDWINSSGGSYHSAVNWFPGAGAPPGPNDGAAFGLAATYTVSFFSSADVSDVYVVNGDVTFDLCPSACSVYTALSVEVTGFGTTPRLTLLQGNMITDALLVSGGGQLDTSNVGPFYANDITITGAGSTWTSDEILALPSASSPGTLDITGGAQVSHAGGWIGVNPDNEATATVSGADSIWTHSGNLQIGLNFGTGTLMIQDGGEVSNAIGRIGADGGNGSVTVTGIGSGWFNTGGISVGRTQGTGTLTVQDNGAVLTPGELLVGNGATGTMNITDTGAVTSGDGFIGVELGGVDGTGTVTVGGANADWDILGRLSVGGNADSGVPGGPGTLDINPGGVVFVEEEIVFFPEGVVRLQGGNLLALAVGFQGGGQFDWTSGTLQVGTFSGDLVNQGGTLLPSSANLTNITGSYTQQSAGAMEFAIGGTTPIDDFNRVIVDDTASLDGILSVSLRGGFTPSAGDMFEIITAADGRAGMFAMEILPTLAGNLDWNVIYGDNAVTLEVVAGLAGDYNDDGSVDAADYVVWRKNDGAQAGYDLWRANFGQSAETGGGSSPVPEPATLLFVGLGGFGPLVAGRRRGRHKWPNNTLGPRLLWAYADGPGRFSV